jgi:Polyketide cyclase / dehydrase and lipid transport
MGKHEIRASETIGGPAALVYQVIADYKNHHGRILPQAYFDGLEVIEGGVGAGTRIHVQADVLGEEQTLEISVTEPEPGHVLLETDLANGIKKTYTVEAVAEASSKVTITTTWQSSGGLRGLLERYFYTRYNRGQLGAEMEELSAYVEALQATGSWKS